MADDSADVAAALGKLVLGAGVGFGLYYLVSRLGFGGRDGGGDGRCDADLPPPPSLCTPPLPRPPRAQPPSQVPRKFVAFVASDALLVAPLVTPAQVRAFVHAHPDALAAARDPSKDPSTQGTARPIDEIASTYGARRWPYTPPAGTGTLTADEHHVAPTVARALAAVGARSGDALYVSASGAALEGSILAILRALKRAGLDLYTTGSIADDDSGLATVTRAHLDEIPQGSINGRRSPVLGPPIGHAVAADLAVARCAKDRLVAVMRGHAGFRGAGIVARDGGYGLRLNVAPWSAAWALSCTFDGIPVEIVRVDYVRRNGRGEYGAQEGCG